MPFENHRLMLRGEAFNAFFNTSTHHADLSLATPSTFGELTKPTAPRVMQFALRLRILIVVKLLIGFCTVALFAAQLGSSRALFVCQSDSRPIGAP